MLVFATFYIGSDRRTYVVECIVVVPSGPVLAAPTLLKLLGAAPHPLPSVADPAPPVAVTYAVIVSVLVIWIVVVMTVVLPWESTEVKVEVTASTLVDTVVDSQSLHTILEAAAGAEVVEAPLTEVSAEDEPQAIDEVVATADGVVEAGVVEAPLTAVLFDDQSPQLMLLEEEDAEVVEAETSGVVVVEVLETGLTSEDDVAAGEEVVVQTHDALVVVLVLDTGLTSEDEVVAAVVVVAAAEVVVVQTADALVVVLVLDTGLTSEDEVAAAVVVVAAAGDEDVVLLTGLTSLELAEDEPQSFQLVPV